MSQRATHGDSVPDALASVDTSAPSRQWSRVGSWTVSLEAVLWIGLIAAAVATRFWDLGYRALHHDESLHAYYSWLFATGEGYTHNPLMHGPFLFFGDAMVFKIFGASDASARYLPAAFGVAIVALPWLLRGRAFLGRWGALAAGFLFLISPSFLYYTRYIRHDPYTVGFSLLLAICIFRYLEAPATKWMVIGSASVALLIANHEIVFAIVLAMVMVLWGALLVTRLRVLIPVHLVAAFLAAIVYLTLLHSQPWPAIPWENATPAETERYYQALLDHPFTLGMLAVVVVFALGCFLSLRWAADRTDVDGSWNEKFFGDAEPNSVAYGAYHVLRDPMGIVISALLGLVILVVLFTTVFTNMHGLATMTYAPDGTLLYWLGQQDVRRGSQPWFYFLTEGFQYEWLGIFFTIAALVFLAWSAVRVATGHPDRHNLLFNAFLGWWFLFLFAVLSWAGEKMPWLIVHFSLPAFLLSATLINSIVEGAIVRYRDRRITGRRWSEYGVVGLFASLIILAIGWLFLLAHLTFGIWEQEESGAWARSIPAWASNDWWLLALPPLAAILLIAVAIWLAGPRPTAYATVAAVFVVFSLFQIHQGFRLAYQDGDVPKDTLIYNTTSPDVNRLTDEMVQVREMYEADPTLSEIPFQIQFDGFVQWPMFWYLRDFPGQTSLSNTPPTNTASGPAFILAAPKYQEAASQFPQDLQGYTMQHYVLRWHEWEDAVYRHFAIAPELPPGYSAYETVNQPHGLIDIVKSIWSSFSTLTTMEGQQRLARLVLYRESPSADNPYSFNVYIRNDVLPLYNQVHYGTVEAPVQ